MGAIQQALLAGKASASGATDSDWASVALRGLGDALPFDDVSPTPKTVTNTGSAVTLASSAGASGQFNDAARFAGTALKYGSPSDWKFLHNGSKWSWEFWLRCSNGFGTNLVLWKTSTGTTAESGMFMQVINTTRLINLQIYAGTPGVPYLSGSFSAAFPNDTAGWHFVRITLDPTLGSNQAALSIDGGTESFQSLPGNAPSAADPATELLQGAGTMFMDDWRITNGVIRPNTLPTAAFPTS